MERQEFDSDYVRRLREGDQPTERHFTRYFGELLLVKLRSRPRSPELVEDARQETFLRVLITLRKNGLEHPERLGAFVNSVCNNVLLEFYRKDGRTTGLPEGYDEPAGEGASPDTSLVTSERRRIIRNILAELSPKDRGLLRDVFIDEKDKDAVCAGLGVDRQYLRVLLHRAVVRFRSAMDRTGMSPR